MASANVAKIRKVVEKISTYRRKKYWDNDLRSRCYSQLSSEQKKEVLRYFERFGVRINPEYVAFYISTTGVFCPEYIPDDLYYCKIDPYFNNWGLAEFIDNKCYYSSIFPTVKQPNMLAYRMNGIWFINSEIGDLKTVLGRVSGHNAFIKQATESEGGHGVTYCRGGQIKKKSSK